MYRYPGDYFDRYDWKLHCYDHYEFSGKFLVAPPAIDDSFKDYVQKHELRGTEVYPWPIVLRLPNALDKFHIFEQDNKK